MATLVNYTCNSFIKIHHRVAQPHQEFPGVPARDIPSFSAEKGEMSQHCGERRHWSLRFEPLISAQALPCLN